MKSLTYNDVNETLYTNTVRNVLCTNNGSELSKYILTISNLIGEAGELMDSTFKHDDNFACSVCFLNS